MNFKTCSKCDQEKLLVGFAKSSKGKLGRQSECILCAKERRSSPEYKDRINKKYLEDESFKNKMNDNSKRYQKENKESVLYTKRNYYEKTKAEKREQELLRIREWKLQNPDKVNSYTAKRRSQKLKALPSWFEQEWERFLISEIYKLKHLRQIMLNIELHVDHIVPLISDKVCGFHCASNLAIVAASANMSKGNRFWPDMPQITKENK